MLVILGALSAALVACGDGDEDTDSGGSAAAFEVPTLGGVESGVVDLSLQSRASSGGNRLDMSVSGPFQRGGDQPQFDLAIEATGSAGGQPIAVDGGLAVVDGEAFLSGQSDTYSLGAEGNKAIGALFPTGDGDERSGCEEAARELDLGAADFARNLEERGTADVNGTETTVYSASLDIPVAADALVSVLENKDCVATLETSEFYNFYLSAIGPKATADAIRSAVESNSFELYVGDDGIVRRITGDAVLDPQGSLPSTEIDFELTLNEINEKQEIAEPSDAKQLSFTSPGLETSPIALVLVLKALADQLLAESGG